MKRWAAALLLLCLWGCQVPATPGAAPPALVQQTVPATDPADERIAVLLHGYGSNEQDLLSLAPRLGLNGRVVSFRAPQTAGRGWAWFPIEFTDTGTSYPSDAADAAVLRLASELRSLGRVHDAPIVVVGFSQGAMLSMMLAVEHPDTVDASVALSGALPRQLRANGKASPIFAVHGVDDDIIPIERARTANAWLRDAGADVELLEVPGLKHRTSPAALTRASEWLTSNCAASGCAR